MELRQIKTFFTVAKFLNFNRSAKILNYSQSTISAQIKALEDDLGVSLFNRIGKHVELTDKGHILCRYAEKLLSLQDETYAHVGNVKMKRGILSVRAPQTIGTYYLPSVIESFNDKFPQVDINISCSSQYDLRQEIKSGIVDVAFLLTETYKSQDLISQLLGIEQLLIVSSKRHSLAQRSHIGFVDLHDQILIMPNHDWYYKMHIERILKKTKIQIKKVIEYNCIEAIKQCLLRGIGISILPRAAVTRQIYDKQLVELPLSDDPIKTEILMIWDKEKWISPSVKLFMDVACHVIGQATTN